WTEGMPPPTTPRGGKLARAYKEQAKAEAQLGDDRPAIESYKSAYALDGEWVEGMVLAGKLCEKLERWDDAAEAYGKAATVQPGEIELHATYGGLLERLGRHAEAAEAWEKAV